MSDTTRMNTGRLTKQTIEWLHHHQKRNSKDPNAMQEGALFNKVFGKSRC